MRRIAWYTAVVLLTIGVVLLLWEFRSAILLFFISLVIAAAFRPVVESFREAGLPQILAILIPYVVTLALFIGLIILVSKPLGNELQQATDNFAVQYRRFRTAGMDEEGLRGMIAQQLPPLDNLYDAITGEQGVELAQTVFGIASNVASVLASFGIALILSMYWSVDRVRFERLWLSLLPVDQRSRWRAIWRETENGLGAYIRSEFVQMVFVALLLGILYYLLGLRYPILLALFGSLAWLIPWLGAVLAVIPPFLVGLGTGGIVLGLFAAALTLAVLLYLELVVEPIIFNRRNYSSLLVVLMLFALGDAFGLVGLLIAPPLAAAVQIVFSHILPQPTRPPTAEPAEQIEKLREELLRVQEMAIAQDEPPEKVESLVGRLKRLIDQAEEALQSETTSETKYPVK